MLSLILRRTRSQGWRTTVGVLGLAVVTTASLVMVLASHANAIALHNTLKTNFRGAYDLLVRPSSSYSAYERAHGLVRDNYLSGIYGGITERQYAAVRGAAGVSVAAPIANLGTVLAQAQVVIPLRRLLEPASTDELLRVHLVWQADNGLSSYPATDDYVYVTHRRMSLSSTYRGPVVIDGRTGRAVPACDGFADSRQLLKAPFVPANASELWCYSWRPIGGPESSEAGQLFAAQHANIAFRFLLPMNVAAIDPVEESRLVGLAGTVVSGRYLSERDGPVLRASSVFGHTLEVPVLEASRTYVDDVLSATVERLHVPPGADLPTLLASGACRATSRCEAATATAESGGAAGFLSRREGATIGHERVAANEVYRAALHPGGPSSQIASLREITVDGFWQSGDVRYASDPVRRGLVPQLVENPSSVWRERFFTASGYLDQPTDNRDVQFRHVREAIGNPAAFSGQLSLPNLHPVGRFDPAQLPGFSSLSAVPLETYYPPAVEAGDPRTARSLGNQPLGPDQNLGGYIQQPDLILMTLSGLKPFLAASRYSGIRPVERRAPISAIRVRVAGVTGTDAASMARIRAVALNIHRLTGLAVDVTAGSSPKEIPVDLPAGRYGRPKLVVDEGWTKTGVSVVYLTALDRKDLALVLLQLIVGCLYAWNTSAATVRASRSEIGLLKALGWGEPAIGALVLAHAALIGCAAGAISVGASLLLTHLFGVRVHHVWVMFLALPLAVSVSLLGGGAPALRASRERVVDALRPSHRRVDATYSRLLGLASTGLRRRRSGTAISIVALGISVAATTVVVGVETSFHRVVVGTLLGDALAVQGSRLDKVAIAVMLTLACTMTADGLYVAARARAGQMALLRAVGWTGRKVALLSVYEALLVSATGAFAGALLGLPVSVSVLHLQVTAVLWAAGAAAAVAAGSAVAASLLPLALATRTAPMRYLREA